MHQLIKKPITTSLGVDKNPCGLYFWLWKEKLLNIFSIKN